MGHVFSLRARDGGLRERKGYMEAAVEFCRLAGKRVVEVINKLMEDGEEEVKGLTEMKNEGRIRSDTCLAFKRRWGLKGL